ncbi:hypothetical protein WDU94_013886, partial [Cyamophila willieti]
LLQEQSSLDEEVLEKEQDKIDEYTALYFKTKKMAEKLIVVNNQEDARSGYNTCHSQAQIQGQALYKLPPLKLKEFGGDLRQWLPFWAQFEKIHLDPNMPAVDKLGYLSMCIVKDSPAQRVINSYPATEAMYPEVIKALNERFGRSDLLTELYIREMMSLVLQNTVSKTKMSVSDLYDKLQSHLRNLDSLGVTTENYASILMPLVSSSLPSDLLQIWERTDTGATSKEFLDSLLNFLKCEVEQAQKMKLAQSNFGLTTAMDQHAKTREVSVRLTRSDSKQEKFATATGLINNTSEEFVCIFCNTKHKSYECLKAKSMPDGEKQELIKQSRACFNCLRKGHRAFQCKANIKCKKCSGRHYDVMCSAKSTSSCVVSNRIDSVLLQTLVVKLLDPFEGKSKDVRVLIDTGSQRSYIVKQVAQELGYKPIDTVSVRHALFGGGVTKAVDHNVYRLKVSSVVSDYRCNFEVMDQDKICTSVPIVPSGSWMQELAEQNIQLSDNSTRQEVDILIGSDTAAKMWTGRVHKLECGLVAMETHMGWTLSGKIPRESNHDGNVATLVTNLLIKEASINHLWDLDTLGIMDPTEKMSQAELCKATEEHFLKTVGINEEGRYEVRLPFLANHPPLSSNYGLSEKRLDSTLRKLKSNGHELEYGKVLESWLETGIIERVPDNEVENLNSHYLPHHPVFKVGSTTPLRPVFDASAKENGRSSLNQSLEKGPNLIQKIPTCLAHFRENQVGLSGDIAKAFLQIAVNQRDRDFLRFLWRDATGQLITYRHCRVVFGISASPFLLESCIQLHLQDTLKASEEGKIVYPPDLVRTLRDSFYVDNCLISVGSIDEAQKFTQAATAIMSERNFNLRGWEMSGEDGTPNVLGLDWDKSKDTLSINTESVRSMKIDEVTKKTILSAAHRLFDPPGFVSPVVLVPKLLLQRTWEENLGWNEPVSEDTRAKFLQWLEEIPHLDEVRIPRWAMTAKTDGVDRELHIFTDASKSAYATVIYLLVRRQEDVQLHLLGSKARVAPTSKTKKGMTIPRLELLAALIGARLFSTVVEDFRLKDVTATFWTDATTVLAWLGRPDDPWDVYVRNRVVEIKKLTGTYEWRHVPGEMNPADMASRGCSPKKFVKSKWWEGPQWLLTNPETWPQGELKYNRDEIQSELRKSVVSATVPSAVAPDTAWYNYFSRFKKIVRMIGWMLRFRTSSKYKAMHGRLPESRDLTAEEYQAAEMKVLWLCQREGPLDMDKLNHLSPFTEEGLIRLKTKISNREDDKDFCHPIVLPGVHPVIQRLVINVHLESSHAGTQMLLSILRQRYWITGGRRIIRTVLNTCVTCKRYTSKHIQTKATPLPIDRVRDAQVFEVAGVDFAGPLFIRNDSGETKKVWVCLFTCAVYRAVRLELVSSLSTDSFIMALKRFCSRQNRPSIMYSDNGSNFTGFKNASEELDWNAIACFSSARKIEWRFIPPASPWWGGWWERLIGVMKTVMKKVLGRTYVNYEVLQTILCDIESVINLRPLTYLSEDPSDLAVLTPAMFLHEIQEVGVPEWDLVQPSDLRKRYQHRQELVKNLRVRFRTEYLGQLKLFTSKKSEREVKVGDMILIGDDNVKRMDWPIGVVTEVIEGRDSVVRVVRVRTSNGTLTRPVQRIYPLEFHIDPDVVSATEIDNVSDQVVCESDNLTSNPGFKPVARRDRVELKIPTDRKKTTRVHVVPRSQITRSGRVTSKPSRFD